MECPGIKLEILEVFKKFSYLNDTIETRGCAFHSISTRKMCRWSRLSTADVCREDQKVDYNLLACIVLCYMGMAL